MSTELASQSASHGHGHLCRASNWVVGTRTSTNICANSWNVSWKKNEQTKENCSVCFHSALLCFLNIFLRQPLMAFGRVRRCGWYDFSKLSLRFHFTDNSQSLARGKQHTHTHIHTHSRWIVCSISFMSLFFGISSSLILCIGKCDDLHILYLPLSLVLLPQFNPLDSHRTYAWARNVRCEWVSYYCFVIIVCLSMREKWKVSTFVWTSNNVWRTDRTMEFSLRVYVCLCVCVCESGVKRTKRICDGTKWQNALWKWNHREIDEMDFGHNWKCLLAFASLEPYAYTIIIIIINGKPK